jgi:hypothetical protein
MSDIGLSDEQLKITFVVTAKQDPELYRWLCTHSFKSTSAAIRALLNIGTAAITALGESLPASQTTTAEAPTPKLPKVSHRKVEKAKKPDVVDMKHFSQTQITSASGSSLPSSKTNDFEAPNKPSFITSNTATLPIGEPIASNDSIQMNAALDAFAAFDKRF